MVQDISTVVDDIAKVKTDLAPVLEWISEQQKAAEAAKAAEEVRTAEDLAKDPPPEPTSSGEPGA
jgi:hypothetical protein